MTTDASPFHTHILGAKFSVWSPSTAATLLRSKPTVKLHFVFNNIHRILALDPENEAAIRSEPIVVLRDPNRYDSIAKVHRSILLFHDSTPAFNQIIHSKLLEHRQSLRRWSGLDSMVSEIIESVRNLSDFNNDVHIHVDFLRYHVCNDIFMQRFFHAGSYGMKPASKSAKMEMLKKVDFDQNLQNHGDDDDDERCTVCLEDLGREEVLSMPCSHRFHGECILKWLDNSHYCPLCRFQMPTEQ